MITWRGLWHYICSPEALRAALSAAARGKRRSVPAAAFIFRAEHLLRRLHAQLADGSWTPAPARLLFIREPKPRAISVAPFESRVVHHALCDVIEPLLARSYTPDTFACLKGRGSHHAVVRHRALMRRHRYLVQLDVRKYFPSINHGRLLGALSGKLKDAPVLQLIGRILEADAGLYRDPRIASHLGDARWRPEFGRGLPVGYLTSQVFGNFYLSPLDHYIKRVLKVPGYIRYMDNLTLFSDRRKDLRRFVGEVRALLHDRLDLDLREARIRYRACHSAVDYLGYVVRRERHEPGKRLWHRLGRCLQRAARRPHLSAHPRVLRSLDSYRGFLSM